MAGTGMFRDIGVDGDWGRKEEAEWVECVRHNAALYEALNSKWFSAAVGSKEEELTYRNILAAREGLAATIDIRADGATVNGITYLPARDSQGRPTVKRAYVPNLDPDL